MLRNFKKADKSANYNVAAKFIRLNLRGEIKMGIADDIKRLGNDIVASYDTRVKALGDLVANIHKTLEGFASDRKKMADEQAKDLAGFVKDLTKNVADMLKKFQGEHKDMSEALSKSLSEFVKDLTKNVGAMMKVIASAHKKMAADLEDTLEKGEADRLKDFKAMIGNIKKEIKDIENYIAKRLKEFSDAHADMSEQQKKDLASYVEGVASEVKSLLNGYNAEMVKAKSAWEGIASALNKSRKSGKLAVSASTEVKTVEEAVKKPKKKKSKKKK